MHASFRKAVALGLLISGFAALPESRAADAIAVAELARETHIHGLAVDRKDPAYIFIATHHGLFHAGPDGNAVRISVVQDFMGFKPHPADPNALFASGHPPTGGNLGFIRSDDQGKTWLQVSPGLGGPVDFHQMAVSPADPKTIYGAYKGLQVSRDGGRTWEAVAPEPRDLIALGASAKTADTLYAATQTGLLASTDAGKTWKPVLTGAPVTLVEATADAILYAFVVGRGLVRSSETALDFTDVGNLPRGGIMLHLAIDPTNTNRLFAATTRGRILMSADQGRTWKTFGSP